jgi:hypothetical protein
MKDPCRAPRGSSVQQDWRAWLPQEKAEVFHQHEHYLETLYNMFSVSLNEAIELRQAGLLRNALKAVSVTSELCPRLTCPLGGTLRALHDHARHYGTIPNAAPLDSENYQSQKGRRSARFGGLLNRVLFSQRLQFLQKVQVLEEMVDDLDRDFRQTVSDLIEGVGGDPQSMWREVDIQHYDLNTCLRETMVLFKSFLVVLPFGQLGAFQSTIEEQSRFLEIALPTAHRRLATFAGQ